MKPETILQTDLLDLIFNNRNKAYGAYTLRKHYNERLIKAMAFTFAVVAVLSFCWLTQPNDAKNLASAAGRQPVTDIYLKSADEPKKLKPADKLKAAYKKPVAQIQYAQIKIVPDEKADKPVAKVEDLNDKMISTISKAGAPANAVDFLPPAEEGNKNDLVIEPEKAAEPEVVTPLVRAEIMPEYPGGSVAFNRFMLRNLHEANDLQDGEKVVVIIKFIVEADGTIEGAEVLKSGGKYDDEVLRAVRKMPRWKPGMQNGRFVPVYFTLPVTFAGPEL